MYELHFLCNKIKKIADNFVYIMYDVIHCLCLLQRVF